MKLHSALLAALLSSALVAGQPEDRRAIVASVDPALLAGPAPLAAPLVFAHGNLGIPRVITWATTTGVTGIAWGTTSAIVAGNAYVSYNGTDMILNVPTGDGFSFLVNNVEIGGLPTAGGFETNVIQILSGTTLTINDAQANAGPVFTDAGTTVDTALDGALTVTGASTFNAAVLIDGTADAVQLLVQGFSTQTALPFVVENSAGTDQFTVSNAGAVVALGTLTLTGDASLNGGTGALTVTGNGIFDGSTDVVQLTVQGVAGQTQLALVVEDSAGVDQVTVSASGTTTIANWLLIDGAQDAVQLTVQGFSTQTTFPFVVENSAGTDQFTVSNTGAVVANSYISSGVGAGFRASSGLTLIDSADAGVTITPATTSLTNVTGNLFVTGNNDEVQLTVRANATQTTLPFVVENSAGTDQFTVSNAGNVVALGTLTITGTSTLTGTVAIGGGTPLVRILRTTTASTDLGAAITATCTAETNFSIVGVATTDNCTVSVPAAIAATDWIECRPLLDNVALKYCTQGVTVDPAAIAYTITTFEY